MGAGGNRRPSGDEEHPEAVVVSVAWAAGDATRGHTRPDARGALEAGRLSDQGDSDEPKPANIAHVTGLRPVTLVEVRGHVSNSARCVHTR
jgi:hypothetical protein